MSVNKVVEIMHNQEGETLTEQDEEVEEVMDEVINYGDLATVLSQMSDFIDDERIDLRDLNSFLASIIPGATIDSVASEFEDMYERGVGWGRDDVLEALGNLRE